MRNRLRRSSLNLLDDGRVEVIGRIRLFSALYAIHKASQAHENAAPNVTFFRTNASCDIMMWCWESTLSSWLRGAISFTRELQWNIESNQPIAPSCHKHCLICTGNYFKASFHSVGFFNVFRALPCPLTQHVVPASVASSCGRCGPPLCELYITSALTLAASGCSCAGDSTEGLQPGGALRRRWR